MYYIVSTLLIILVTILFTYIAIKQRRELKNLKLQREQLYKEISYLQSNTSKIQQQYSNTLLPEELQEFEELTKMTREEIRGSSIEQTNIFKKMLLSLQYKIASSSVKVRTINELCYRDWSLDILRTLIEGFNQLIIDKETMNKIQNTRKQEREQTEE